MKSNSLKNPLLLLLTAVIWGAAFVAQKEGMEYIEPFTYNGIRSVIGGLVLVAVLPFLDKLRARDPSWKKGDRQTIITAGVVCGVLLFVASNLQQFGIALQSPDTNVGKAGFITACYCAIVPFLGIFMGKRSPFMVWIGVVIAIVGFFMLSLMDGLVAGVGLGLEKSDLLLGLCAIAFSLHILAADHFSPLADGVRISCIQFLVCGVLSIICMFIWEAPVMANILACTIPILYAGVFSCGVAYTLQIVAQNGVHPAVASLILSLESVVSVLAGYILMPGTTLSGWELAGCGLVFAAVVIVQLAPQKN